MKTRVLITLAFIATSPALALAQGSGASGGASSGTAGAAPGGVPSGTGGVGAAPSGGAGVLGGAGPGDTAVRPNIPAMTPSNPTVGRESGDSARAASPTGAGLTSSPSSLNTPSTATGGTSGVTSDPTAPPPGAPRIMVPERR